MEKIKFVIETLAELEPKMQEFDRLIDDIGLSPEGTLCDNVFHMYDALIDSLSMLIDDKEEWLSYFIYDNSWGKSNLQITIFNKKLQLSSLNDLENLLLLIEKHKGEYE